MTEPQPRTGRHAAPDPEALPAPDATTTTPPARWRSTLARWNDDFRPFVAVLWALIAVLVTASLIGAAATMAPDGRQAAAHVLPSIERPDPTAHASGVRGPRTPATSSTPATTSSAAPTTSPDPDDADDARPSTETRACRCAPRSPVATSPSTVPVPDVEPEPSPPGSAEPEPATPQPAATIGLLELVNADRANAGCGPVLPSPSLDSQSQAHAERQAAADAMFHSDGVTGYDTWGENVAAGYDTAAAVHQAWMASDGHRANILNCAFTVMGAGAADSATGVRYWTEQLAA